MAPTGHKSHCLAALLLVAACTVVRADDSADARGQVSHVATALSEGNAADALTPIDKSYANYDKLRNYFLGLTGAFQIVNGIEISDEQDDEAQIILSVHWDLTLTDLQTNYTENRAADVNIKLTRLKGKWKIVDIEPIDIFNPARTRAAAIQ
jgi:hypothetical protein